MASSAPLMRHSPLAKQQQQRPLVYLQQEVAGGPLRSPVPSTNSGGEDWWRHAEAQPLSSEARMELRPLLLLPALPFPAPLTPEIMADWWREEEEEEECMVHISTVPRCSSLAATKPLQAIGGWDSGCPLIRQWSQFTKN